MTHRTIQQGVHVAEGPVVRLTRAGVAFLADDARRCPARRSRLCAHPGPDDRLHEMFILLDGGTYVRPHRHRGKSESFHVVEGELDVVLFHGDGTVRDVVRMGEYATGKTFYYRLADDLFHTVVVRSKHALIHETTNGPFERSDTGFAPWAPEEHEAGAAEYLRALHAETREEP
jgi:cupin fold WbuC family metalloprotein